MLEQIRVQVMSRIVEKKKCVNKWINEWCPNCIKKFQAYIEIYSQCVVTFNCDDGFEITYKGDRHTIFLYSKLCTCRA